LSIGFFAYGQPAAGTSPFTTSVADPSAQLTGLFYGGGLTVLKAQCIGSFIVCASTFAVAMTVFAVLNAMGLLRVSREGELDGDRFTAQVSGLIDNPDRLQRMANAARAAGRPQAAQEIARELLALGKCG